MSRELSSTLSMLPVRTPTLPPATHTNSYALGSREVVLVEPATPYEDEQRNWIDWARALASTGRKAKAIVVTHHHADHVGGLSELARALGLQVWAHPETISRIDPSLDTKPIIEGDSFVLDGPIPTRWEVMHTPGHAPGHVCLFERGERTLIVGDMVASVGTILIAPGDGHMATYLGQLERLEKLDASLALPAHGEPIDAPSALFAHYRKHRGLRETKVLDAFTRAPRDAGDAWSAEALLPYAYDDTSVAVHPIALISLKAHLEKLVEDGRVVVASDGTFRLPG